MRRETFTWPPYAGSGLAASRTGMSSPTTTKPIQMPSVATSAPHTMAAQIDLERNKDWWGQFSNKPYDHVIDRFVTEASNRARGLEGGEYDLANFVPRDEATRIGKSSGFSPVEGNNLWTWPALYRPWAMAVSKSRNTTPRCSHATTSPSALSSATS